jgi:Holliday junction resolvase
MSRSRAKGTAWESALVGYLIDRGWPHAERRALNGNQDKGDIAGIVGWVIEAKNTKGITLAAWAKELEAEVRNAKAPNGALWIKRVGRGSPADGYVVLDGTTFTRLLREAGY